VCLLFAAFNQPFERREGDSPLPTKGYREGGTFPEQSRPLCPFLPLVLQCHRHRCGWARWCPARSCEAGRWLWNPTQAALFHPFADPGAYVRGTLSDAFTKDHGIWSAKNSQVGAKILLGALGTTDREAVGDSGTHKPFDGLVCPNDA